MNHHRIEGATMLLIGRVQTVWGKVTHNDMHVSEGCRKQRVGLLKHHRGIAAELADREVDRWQR